MSKNFVLRKPFLGIALLIAGLLSACGGGGGGSGTGGANSSIASLALFAGNMGGAGTADGTGSTARFNYPGSVATDKIGRAHV